MTTALLNKSTQTSTRESARKSPSKEWRLEVLGRLGMKEEELQFVENELFESAKAEAELWGPDSLDVDTPRYSLLPEVESKSPDKQSRYKKRASLTKGQERILFLRYNYSKYRLDKLMRARKYDHRELKKRIRLWHRRARQTRETIAHANFPLVPSMAMRSNIPGVEFSELLSEGYMAVMRAIEHFDVGRGFKFSTYACRAILSAFRRLGSKAKTYHKHIPCQFEPEMEKSDFPDRRHHDQRDTAIEAVRQVLQHNSANLSEIEYTILGKRFPMLSGDRRKTLSQVGKIVGLSDERVRQIEFRSLSKLRNAVENWLGS
ncbi:MAG: sigma-70 family RNA polymerase sigma factor [Phycisphaerae bacterium]